MKDAFGHEIAVTDTIVYGMSRSSSARLSIGVVTELRSKPGPSYKQPCPPIESIRVQVVAGSGYEFTMGHWRDGKREPYAGRSVVLHEPLSILVVNGLDVAAIVEAQRKAFGHR